MSPLPKFDAGALVPPQAQAAAVQSFSPTNWRSHLRSLVGTRGEKVFSILMDLAEGRPWIPQLVDGRQLEPMAPTAEIRLRATIHLTEMLFGKAVSQTEQVDAEGEASEMEAIRALSDDELEKRARSILERGIDALDARQLPESTDAEVVPGIREWAFRIYDAAPSDEG